jgi:methyl-accepting chemotaxis protein
MALKLSITQKILLLVLAAMAAGMSAMLLFASSQNQALLRSELTEADVTVSIASTEQLAGAIRFGKADTLATVYANLSASIGPQFAAGASYGLEANRIGFTDSSRALAPVMDGLAADAIAAGATRQLSQGAVSFVAVPAYFGPEKAMVGATVFAWDRSANFARAAETTLITAAVGAGLLLAIGLGLALFVSTLVTRPLRKIVASATAMARAVQIFRENGLQVARLTAAEAARIIRDQSARTEMMQTLQLAFGEVVDAAIAGDFSKRVAARFPDAELNGLAGSVNALVETVDRGLGETGTVLAALARTDLTQRMHGDYAGAFAKLKADTNAVGDTLTGIVTQLRNTSRALKTATGEILSGANDLSERTTRQAATIEQTSATMEQIAETVAANAGMAENASAKAQSVYAAAEKGGAVMGQANEAMSRITQSSARISNVIGLIDDIAFQTNLLALNASVEAARAGEAGKGFAVVAVEVRRLAQSAAEASREVKVLIEQSAAEVRDGSKLVADAAGTLTGMLQAVHENTTLLEQIARASRQQSQAIGEVNTGVRQMDEMTQHNAALVEQTNAAIEQTEAQASELDRVVDVFTIDAVHATRVQKPQPARPQRPARAYLSEGNAAIAQDWAEF